MKNVKVFSLILVLTLFAGLFLVNTNVNAEEKETFNYVSFGASNVNGYGLDGYMPDGVTAENKDTANVYGYERCPEGSYPDLIKDYYSEKYEVEHHQLAISSMRAEELRVLLDNSYDGDDYTEWRFTGGANWFLNAEPGGLEALRAAYQEHTANADLITLDIGVNNFGVFLGHNLFKASGDRHYELSDIDPELAENFELAKLYVEQVLVEAGVSEEAIATIESFDHSINIAAYALAGYCYNFDVIVDKIYELNPDVKLVVVSVQHLLQDMSIKLPGVDQLISFNYLTGALVRAANLYISGVSRHADSYLFADVSENGHVEFFDQQMEEWDGIVSSLDGDMIDCFNIYDDDLFIKDTVINYFNTQTPYPWDLIGQVFGVEVQNQLLESAYYPIAKIMQAGCKVDVIDLAGTAGANTGAIENALLGKIFGELEASVMTKVAQITEGYTGTYEFDEEAFFEIPGVDSNLVRSIAGYAVYTGIGNSFYSHPNRNGHKEIADTVIATIENETKGEVHAKAELVSILTSLYELTEKYGASALQFIYGKLEEKGIIDQLVNEVIEVQNQVVEFNNRVENQTIAQLEAVKAYLEAKVEKFEENPEEAVSETVAEIKWALGRIEEQIAVAKEALTEAGKALEPVVAELVELVEYLAAKPEVQEATMVILAKLDNAVNAFVEANVDFEAVEAALEEACATAKVIEAKVVELSLEAKALKAELEAYAEIGYEKAVEVYGVVKAEAMAALAKAEVEANDLYGKAVIVYEELLDKATLEKAQLLAELEVEIDALVEKLTGVEFNVRQEVEEFKAEVEAYLADLEAQAIAKAEEIYNGIVDAYEGATNGSYVTSEDSYYVAFGDSSVEGESYVDLIASGLHIENYDNLAQKGMRLEDVLYLLSDVNGDAYYQANYAELKDEFIAAVEAADFITLGFNNFDFALAQFGTLEPAELDWSLYLPVSAVSAIEKLLAEVDAELTEALGEYKSVAMTLVSSLLYNYVGSVYNYGALIEAIAAINPKATVVSVGMYNPFASVQFEYEGVSINVGEYFSYLIKAIDALHLGEAMVASDAIVVALNGVETEFDAIVNESGLEVQINEVVTQLFTNPDVFLPSEAGHATIADAVLGVIAWECAHVAEADDHDCTTPVLCKLCGEILVPGAVAHTPVVIPAVAATCSKVGYTEGSQCSVCGTILVEPEEVAQLEHTYDNTCDVDCNVCGASRTPGQHVYDNRCDELCNICGGKRRTLGHVFGEWVVVEESTKHDHGKEARVCNECGYVEYRELPLAEGMGAGAVVAIVGGSTVVAAAGGFSVFWFGIKKRKFSDLKKIFKK